MVRHASALSALVMMSALGVACVPTPHISKATVIYVPAGTDPAAVVAVVGRANTVVLPLAGAPESTCTEKGCRPCGDDERCAAQKADRYVVFSVEGVELVEGQNPEKLDAATVSGVIVDKAVRNAVTTRDANLVVWSGHGRKNPAKRNAALGDEIKEGKAPAAEVWLGVEPVGYLDKDDTVFICGYDPEGPRCPPLPPMGPFVPLSLLREVTPLPEIKDIPPVTKSVP